MDASDLNSKAFKSVMNSQNFVITLFHCPSSGISCNAFVHDMMFAFPKRVIRVVQTIYRNHFYFHWRNVRCASKDFISTEETHNIILCFKMCLFPLEISEHYL